MLFVRNVDLQPNENLSSVIVRGEDAQLSVFPLTVEHISKLTGYDFSEMVVRLPDNLPTNQTLFVSLTLRGQTSNKPRFTMK